MYFPNVCIKLSENMSSNVGAVESWHNFLTQCQQAIERFRERWGQTAIPFFRGQRDARWSVTPGAFRGPFNAYAEQAIYYEFKSGASMLLGSTLGPWDVLFTM